LSVLSIADVIVYFPQLYKASEVSENIIHNPSTER